MIKIMKTKYKYNIIYSWYNEKMMKTISLEHFQVSRKKCNFPTVHIQTHKKQRTRFLFTIARQKSKCFFCKHTDH